MLQPVDLSKKLILAHGVVCGMEYLHSIRPRPVIHGDLKTQNVLVGDDLVAKVCACQKTTLQMSDFFVTIYCRPIDAHLGCHKQTKRSFILKI